MNATDVNEERCFIDTNILLYAFIEGDAKQKHIIAKSVIQKSDVVVSTQVVNEVCVNLLKKTSLLEKDIQDLIVAFYEKYRVVDINKETLLKASQLRGQFSFSYWDSLIVANALNADCAILYTEDLQDGLKLEERLTIINPFTNQK